ncbi:MAG TPA: 2,3-bisphosphoglycerate-independent phosphoglycerate mutase, partial [Patescibacteria group bacterium]|nr:2,3-bisphosphoglycerate-independent phosphoglycerate mutase [Patescibacteria group bacterium]
GHLNLGAGRVVEQDIVVISGEIRNGRFFKNPAFISAIDHAQKNKSKVHLMGLLSADQSPHVDMGHVYALLRLLDQEGVERVYLHLFTDGRDAPQHAAPKFLKKLRQNFLGNEKIASVCGRFYGMDRNKKWDRTKAAYDLLTLGKGHPVESAEEAILQAYNRKETDEYIEPSVIMANGRPVAAIEDNDSVIFFNLRSDRARQLAKTFVQKNFEDLNKGGFERKKFPKNIRFVAMSDFGPDLNHILTAYPSKDLSNTLPMLLKDYGQLYLSETEKYAHVTYFFNGGYDSPVAGEERILYPSPYVKNYAETPQMSLPGVMKILCRKIRTGKEFITVNFCNPDMIGHTGDLRSAIRAVEACDQAAGKVAREVLKKKGVLLITADHGNVEEMINLKTGEVDTEHSLFPVPFIMVSKQYARAKLRDGILGDVAPTILELFGLKKPKEMTGKSLLVKS